jgi:hypothetical protein
MMRIGFDGTSVDGAAWLALVKRSDLLRLAFGRRLSVAVLVDALEAALGACITGLQSVTLIHKIR